MPVETITLSEQEEEVIQAAIEYVNQVQHGLYIDVARARIDLVSSVETLQQEHDGRWQPNARCRCCGAPATAGPNLDLCTEHKDRAAAG